MATILVRAGLQYAWRGPSLLIAGSDGRVDAASDPLHGFYYREARCLSRIDITVNGRRPWLCESAAMRADLLSFTYVHPEITKPGGGGTGQSGDEQGVGPDGLPERSLDLSVTYEPCTASLRVTTTVANRARRAVQARVQCSLTADFADLIEVQANTREQTAPVQHHVDGHRLLFEYQHPELPLGVSVDVADGWCAGDQTLFADLHLEPSELRTLVFDVVPFDPEVSLAPEDVRRRARRHREWVETFTHVEVPGNRLVEQILASNMRDIGSLASLDGAPDEWLTPFAGMPLYPAFFGRDALTAGWQAALLDGGDSLAASLVRLGRLQASDDDAVHEAEPGRIPYQMRSGPLARLGLNPYTAYYADYASPLMYVIALANLFAWTGDLARMRQHWDTARRVMDWARTRGDADGDGYLEYHTRSREGTKNQGWKDSGDAIVYDDGSPVPPPIATCELQGYWYAAQQLMAMMSAVMGERSDANAYRHDAGSLRERFNRDWWMEEEQFFGLALDPDKRLIRAVTSNVGHLLASGIIDRTRLAPVVGRLFAPDLFSGWGVRTLSTAHAYYDPLSYHRGTVWAVEQGTIVFGLRRYGFDARAADLAGALFDLAQLYPDYRIPECIGGYGRAERPSPGAYPRANTPQLWNASALVLVLQCLLGITPLAPARTLIVDPVLPEWMPEVRLRRLRVGDAHVTLRFGRRPDGRTDWDVEHVTGTLRVIRQPPPESTTASATDRLSGLIQSLAG